MNIVVIGQGGHSKVIKELILLNPQNYIVAYLDDKYEEFKREDNLFTGPILAARMIVKSFKEIKFIIAIGNNSVRKRIVRMLNLPKESYLTLIHPKAIVSKSVTIGSGVVIMANAVINADTQIDDHTIINTSAVIEHDNQIGQFVHVSPNATLTGEVKVNHGVHIGAGATILPNLTIGEWSVIGAGATVINPIPANSMAVGVPAVVKKQIMEVYK